MLNLLNRGAQEMLSPTRVVEALPPITDVTLRVRQPAAPQAVALVPADGALSCNYADGILQIAVPIVAVHNIVVIE